MTLQRTTPNQDSLPEPAVLFQVDPIGMTRLLLQKRRWIIWMTGMVGVLAAVIMLLTPNRYTSQATILPSGKSDSFSALKAVAGLGGMSVSDDATSSALFPVILQSNLVVDSVLAASYRVTIDGVKVDTTLADYFGQEDPDKLRRALRNITRISSDTRTGEIMVAAETVYPELSQGIVTEYLAQLENYNLYSRRSEAKERVRYLARELEARSGLLAESEDSLEAFQGRNRNWATSSSPTLVKELARRTREAEIRAKTVAYLTQEYEIARLDAQRDVPVVRVLGEASLPTQKSGPFRTITVLTATFVALALVTIAIFGVELVKNSYRQVNTGDRELLQRDIVQAFPRAARVHSRLQQRGHREMISVDSN